MSEYAKDGSKLMTEWDQECVYQLQLVHRGRPPCSTGLCHRWTNIWQPWSRRSGRGIPRHWWLGSVEIFESDLVVVCFVSCAKSWC